MPSDHFSVGHFDFPRDPKLLVARAIAIEQYARLEQSLSRLLAALLDTHPANASVVFYNVMNARSRNAIFQSLIANTHGNQYEAFWNGQPGRPGVRRASGLLALISQLDDERNHIVHWHTVQSVGAGESGIPRAEELLVKPEFWLREPAATPSQIGRADLEAFARKAEFVSRLVGMFWMFTTGRLPEGISQQAWSQIFQQSVPYPPPNTHPLYPTFAALESRPQSSPG